MADVSKFHKKPFTTIAFLFLLIVAVLHLARIISGWTVSVSDIVIPMWFSYAGAAFGIILAMMLWRENLK